MKNKKPVCYTIDESFLEELIETRKKTGVSISTQLENIVNSFSIPPHLENIQRRKKRIE